MVGNAVSVKPVNTVDYLCYKPQIENDSILIWNCYFLSFIWMKKNSYIFFKIKIIIISAVHDRDI
jgi:hypothetical protein